VTVFKREAAVKRRITAGLKKYDGLWYFMPVQSGIGAAALDYLVCINGRFVAVETKAVNGRLTDRQKHVAKMITDAGGLVYVVRGTEEAEEWVKVVLPRLVNGVTDDDLDHPFLYRF